MSAVAAAAAADNDDDKPPFPMLLFVWQQMLLASAKHRQGTSLSLVRPKIETANERRNKRTNGLKNERQSEDVIIRSRILAARWLLMMLMVVINKLNQIY